MTDLVDRAEALVGIPVEIVDWPRDSRRRDALARAAVPRLLLVAEGASPPDVLGIDEDWVRVPATVDDIRTRAQHLLRLEVRTRADHPYIDDRRILHRLGVSVPLTVREAAMLRLLLIDAGRLVTYGELSDALWPGSTPSRDAVDAATYRLRRRLSGLGMTIRTVRSVGIVLDVSGSD